jgi:two-component system phosphate regulon sensor histidine kinase PhoR
MEGLVSGVLGLLCYMMLGGLAGAGVGGLLGGAGLLAWVGAIIGAVGFLLRDRLRARRLLDWLRGPLDVPAPRQAGFWGELAYRAERALLRRDEATHRERDKREQFLSAIEASPNGVLLLDAQDQIEWCNRVAADHFGLDPLRDVRQPITNLVRTPAFVAYLQAGLYAQAVTYPNPRAQGTVSVLIKPYGPGLKLVLSQDITERERAEAMRRDFVANVSHEIRTPLTVLSGFVETLATLTLRPDEQQRVLHLMGQQTGRMQALVADLLTLAQLEGSPRPQVDGWISVAVLVERASIDAQSLSAGRHQIVVRLAQAAEVAGNFTELQSALGNLVTNAVRYTPAGGHIELRWTLREDGSGLFEVQDDGPGIPREHLARLTERFYRADSGRSRETGGTGLGLAIVKHVIQRHGGEILIDSEPGKGSVFALIVPAARVRALPDAPEGLRQPARESALEASPRAETQRPQQPAKQTEAQPG